MKYYINTSEFKKKPFLANLEVYCKDNGINYHATLDLLLSGKKIGVFRIEKEKWDD